MKKTGGIKHILAMTAIIFLWEIILFLVSGCARIPLSYSPGTINKISGSLSISDFKYVPAEIGKVKPFQIRNKSMGSLKFDKNIDTFFKNAVIAELSSAGIKPGYNNLVLDGEIEDFLIDELSTSADWTLKVNYSVKNLQTGKTLYESTKITKRNVSKLASISRVVNEIIKLNIEELLKDVELVTTIR